MCNWNCDYDHSCCHCHCVEKCVKSELGSSPSLKAKCIPRELCRLEDKEKMKQLLSINAKVVCAPNYIKEEKVGTELKNYL